MSAPGWVHGKNIGEIEHPETKEILHFLRYLSPSAMKTADPGSDGGCFRKFYYQYRLGRKQPSTAAQELGTALHAELEAYAKTGAKNLSALALAGLHMVPKPGDDLLVEVEMSAEFSSTDAEIQMAVEESIGLRLAGDYAGADRLLAAVGIVSASGVPIIGRIDLVHGRGTNQGTDDPSEAIDPPNTVEVYDWKTSSNVERYGKTAAQLGRDIQMLSYGRWVFLVEPGAERVRLSHGYFQTRGRATTRKVSVLLERAELLRRWEYVANLARQIIDVAGAASVEDVPANLSACESFGGCFHRDVCTAGMNKGLRNFFPAAKLKQKPPDNGANTMGVLDKLRAAEAARLAATGAPQGPAIPPEFAAAWTAIKASGATLGLGYPAVGGDAAKYVATLDKLELKGAGFAGTGQLGSATISTLAEAVEVAAELAEMVAPAAEQAPAPISAVAPDVPASDPAIASAGPDGKDPTKKRGPKPKPTPVVPAATKPVESTTPEPTTPEPTTPAATQPIATANAIAATVSIGGAGCAIFVDAVPSIPFIRLNGRLLELADAIAAEMSKQLGIEVHDIRACEAKPLGFGGWKGVYAKHVDGMELEEGTYVVDARGSELMQIAAETLSKKAALYVVGIR